MKKLLRKKTRKINVSNNRIWMSYSAFYMRNVKTKQMLIFSYHSSVVKEINDKTRKGMATPTHIFQRFSKEIGRLSLQIDRKISFETNKQALDC